MDIFKKHMKEIVEANDDLAAITHIEAHDVFVVEMSNGGLKFFSYENLITFLVTNDYTKNWLFAKGSPFAEFL